MSAPGIAATREERIPYLVQRAEHRDRPHGQLSLVVRRTVKTWEEHEENET